MLTTRSRRIARATLLGLLGVLADQGLARAQIVFAPAITVPIPPLSSGSQPEAVAVGDLDGDGDLDVVVANNTDVRVLLNDGAGTLVAAATLALGPNVRVAALADLDGDGDLDLVTQHYWGLTYQIAVFLNNGNATFPSPVFYDLGSNSVQDIALADLDGDKRPDVAVTDTGCAPAAVAVLLNKGDGTLSAPTWYPVSCEFGVAAADLGGNAAIDLAVTSDWADNVAVLPNIGSGTFGPPTTYPTGGLAARGIVAADLNGDGKNDLAVVNAASDTVAVLLNDGAGQFGPAVQYAVGIRPSPWLLATDLDGDGRPDLAVSVVGPSNFDPGSVAVLTNTGKGTFAPPVHFAVGRLPGKLAAGDLNGDGKPDLVVPNAYLDNSLSVLLNHTFTLDHFKGYEVQTGRPVIAREVTLTDQFEKRVMRVLGPKTLMNPVSKNGEPLIDPTAHLTCLTVTKKPEQGHFTTRTVVVHNQFGSQNLTLGSRPTTLCVPSEKDQVESTLKLSRFKCYSAKAQPSRKLAGKRGDASPRVVDLADQFGKQGAKVIGPVSLCTPVALGEQLPPDPLSHLTCYAIDAPRFGRRTVSVKNEFGAAQLMVIKSTVLCVPSLKEEK